MRRLVVAGAMALVVAGGCGTSSDQLLAERLDAVSTLDCEAVEWEATSEATSDLPDGGRAPTLAAGESEAACGFGTHTWQPSDAEDPGTSPAAVVVVARRRGSNPPFVESDLIAHAARQRISGAGQAEATNPLLYRGHVLVVAVNEEHVGELHPEQLLRTARRDLGIVE